MKKLTNFDNIYSSKWISDVFINYYKNSSTDNPFSQKPFINYLRFIFIHEVLGLFTTKMVKELIWGWDDDLLKLVKSTNYFKGGDPTVDSFFSIGNNRTSIPDDEYMWTMYTGSKDKKLTRQYKSVPGNNQSIITYIFY
jgi:hypothetical protein